MAGARHKLTTSIDRITGGTGNDLFTGPLSGLTHLPTLTSDDRLNGGEGLDTIRATLDDVATAPVMKSIEKGIFSFTEASTIGLDLAKAGQMHDLTMKSGDGLDDAVVEIDNASGVRRFSIDTQSDQTYDLDGLSTKGVRQFEFSFTGEVNGNVNLDTADGSTFAKMRITLADSPELELSGNCLNARNLTIHSTSTGGFADNYVDIDPGTHQGVVRHLTITGDQNPTLYTQSDTYENLTTLDTTGMKAILWGEFGGDNLTKVNGGNGTEIIELTALGGSATNKAVVMLGGGHDDVTLHYAFDAETQVYYGGSGTDTITLDGAAENLNKAAISFEDVHVNNAAGTYDVKGMELVNFLLYSTSGALTINGLADDATLGIYEDVTTYMTVNVAKAGSTDTESLRVLLQNSADVGNSTVGLSATNLSNLQIDSYSSAHTMYLSSVGAADDAANVSITGDEHVTLKATNVSSNFIDMLVIDNDGGANILGLTSGGSNAFVLTGATITGGAGNDVLAGGVGADTISTGGGNDTVYSSLGADTIHFATGINQVLYTAGAHSAVGANHDVITGFGSDDTLDIGSVVSSASFAGNFATDSAGLASLSSSHVSAYFNTATDTLYVDLNHDQQINGSDMQIELSGLSSFSSGMLLA